MATTASEVSAALRRVDLSAVAHRNLALDAFRGFIMIKLVSAGFGLAGLGKRNPAYAPLAVQFEHMPWEWISFWDLIQPAFMFIVGAAMPFALARRIEQGPRAASFSAMSLRGVSG